MTTHIARFALLAVALSPSAYGAGLTKDAKDFSSRTYNYIVVGGGTAGLAVAARLSEDSNRVVGVIEAGQYLPDDPLINTPGLFGATQSNPTYDWCLNTTAQPSLGGRVLAQPRGKVLGGSSALNYMAYDRGFQADYDSWYPFAGLKWKWAGILPYFKKAEDTLAPTVATPFDDPLTVAPFQGVGGPIKKSFNDFYSDVTKPYLTTLNNLGIPTNDSPDSGNATGVYNCPMSVNRKTGKRSYAVTTYLSQAQSRPNFHVLLGAEVSKVNIQGRTAKSVVFTSGGKEYTVPISNEVILSAGSLKTPQILELSGIGNKAILQKYGIPVIRDLPGVGENLQDHTFVSNTFALKPGFTTFDIMRNNPEFAAQQQAQYAKDGSGMLAATHSAFAFFSLDKFIPKADLAAMTQELENEIRGCSPRTMDQSQFSIMMDQMNKTRSADIEIIMFPGYFSYKQPAPGTSYISMLVAHQKPWSRGSVHIQSSKPGVAPIVDPHYLERTFDAKVLAYASMFTRKIAQSQPMAQYISEFHSPTLDVKTLDQFVDYSRTFVAPVYHPIGTASLGAENLGGVVSNRLIVHGTYNLRVVDASVIPMHIAAHLQQTVYAIAEQASDFIKADNVGK